MTDDRTERQDDSAAPAARPPASAAHLCVIHGVAPAATFGIDRGGAVLGRASEPTIATIALADPRMSRRHAEIRASAAGYTLRDLGSRNGGYLDGASFAPEATVPLADGAVIRLGESLFVFRVGEADGGASGAAPTDEPAVRAAFPGRSPVAAAVRERLRRLAASGGHVLVLGETGTGKERVARLVGRCQPPGQLIAQNCAELSKDLGRSELFGHARGAFSGATSPREGLVDAAQGGTLFLDEIGELHLDVQADLLRFLEDGGYRPLGATELRTSRARIIAATNVALDEAVAAGRFRRDLLARLRASNAPLELPSLRDRPDDILDWARFFLDEALPGRAPADPWTAGVAEALVLYPWPENLRELRGVVRGLVEVGTWPAVSTALPERIQAHRRELRAAATAEAGGPASRAAEPERAEIEGALTRTEGRMLPAAELLGIDRRKLYRLCERLGIDIERYRTGG